MMKQLANCKPYTFFYWFEEISKIPRPSYQENQIIDFLECFAKEQGFFYRRDAAGNLLIRVPGTADCANKPSVLLQAHVDMVCVKDPDVVFDFTKQPINLYVDGDMLRAKGTTLGADAGAGVAVMLALADADEVPHPPLELLYTVQEEVGMVGIQKFDLSTISSRRMINLDAGDSHTMCISSAGSVEMSVCRTFPCCDTNEESTISFRIAGGKGGHSGMDIHKNRICAGNLAGKIMSELQDICPVRLSSVETSQTPGTILNACTVCICVPKNYAATVELELRRQFERYTQCRISCDPDIFLSTTIFPSGRAALSPADSLSVISLLSLLDTGVQERSDCYANGVLASSSMGPCVLENGKLTLSYQIRAMEEDALERVAQRYRKEAKENGFTLEETSSYPCWPASKDSPFSAALERVYRKLFGCNIATESIYGGIEAGVVKKGIPSMDIISISPTATAAHTTGEKLHLNEVEPFWELLLALLRE